MHLRSIAPEAGPARSSPSPRAPNQDVRVEEQLHLRSTSQSLSSAAGEMMSPRMRAVPLSEPSQRRGRAEAEGGTTSDLDAPGGGIDAAPGQPGCRAPLRPPALIHAMGPARATSVYGPAYSPGQPGSGERRKETTDLQRNGFKRGDARRIAVAPGAEPNPCSVTSLERLQCALLGVEDPVVGHSRAQIEIRLRPAIAASIARRDDLTDPVGTDEDRPLVGKDGHSLPPPAGQVRHDNLVRFELHVGLDHEPPAAWPPPPAVEGSRDLGEEQTLGPAVGRPRTGLRL